VRDIQRRDTKRGEYTKLKLSIYGKLLADLQEAKNTITTILDADEKLKETYVNNVQLLLFDYGFSDFEQRQAAAQAIVNLIFY